MKILEFNRSGIGLIAVSHQILSGFPNQDATSRRPPLLLLLLLSSPMDYHAFGVIVWMSCMLTMVATMSRMIASIIEGRQWWWFVAITTPEVIVARPATVVASFLRMARYKTKDGGSAHIQPPL